MSRAKALARLDELHDYIAEHPPANAQAVAECRTAKAATPALPPLLGRRVAEYRQDEIREVLDRTFRLIYRVNGGRIESSPSNTPASACPSAPATCNPALPA